MPITPLHLGPGVALKSLGGSGFSLSVFAFAQVAMDVEVLARAALGIRPLHGFSNTFLGATLVFVFCGLAARSVCEWCLRWWNRNLSPAQSSWLGVGATISPKAGWVGAAFGIYSHFLLDAIMHFDARPWAPLSTGNPFLGWLSADQLTWFCLVTLALGLAVVVVARAFGPRASANSNRGA